MNDGLLTIGEFSKLTGLTIKTLRFYHESGLIEPASVDTSSGYRYYAADQVELAIAIKTLRELGFSIEQSCLAGKRLHCCTWGPTLTYIAAIENCCCRQLVVVGNTKHPRERSTSRGRG